MRPVPQNRAERMAGATPETKTKLQTAAALRRRQGLQIWMTSSTRPNDVLVLNLSGHAPGWRYSRTIDLSEYFEPCGIPGIHNERHILFGEVTRPRDNSDVAILRAFSAFDFTDWRWRHEDRIEDTVAG